MTYFESNSSEYLIAEETTQTKYALLRVQEEIDISDLKPIS